MTGEETVPD